MLPGHYPTFCLGKPPALFEQTKPALQALKHLIHSVDEEVVADACWALSYLSDGTNDKIQAVIDAGVCPRLVELLLHPSPTVLLPAFRTVGNIVTGDVAQTQTTKCSLVSSNFLHKITRKASRKKHAGQFQTSQLGTELRSRPLLM